MKKTIIINTHLHSNSEILYASMINHKDIKGCWVPKKDSLYLNNMKIYDNNLIKHKSNEKKSFYLDHLRFNHQLSTRLIDYEKIIIISFLRKPIETIKDIILKSKKSQIGSLRNYTFRMKRMYQIAKKCKKSIFLTYEQLEDKNKIVKLLEKELNIKDLKILNFKKSESKDINLPKNIIAEAEERYEFYHNLFKSDKNIKSIYSEGFS